MILSRLASRALSAALACALVAPPVLADARKIQILRSEGRVDAATRSKIDAAILKLARTTDAQVSPGDITISDAATAVGCKVETSACKDEILNMLGVDEIVYATVTTKPGGTEVVAYRAAKGGVVRDAKAMILVGGAPDKVDGIAPLFFATTTAQLPTNPTASEPPPLAPPPSTPVTPGTPGTPVTLETTTTTTTKTIAPSPEPAQPRDEVDEKPGRRKLAIAGAIGGGASVLLAILCWGKASDLQGQIDDAPSNTAADLAAIRQLENDGDGYAGLGNVLFVGGAVVGGLGAYYLIKHRKRSAPSTTATLTPTLFQGGAGIALIGGLP